MGLRGTVELCLQCCDRFIEVDVFRKSQCSEMAPIFTQRYEKKYGVDDKNYCVSKVECCVSGQTVLFLKDTRHPLGIH